MSMALSEDEIYRTSTQYRLWSFSPEQVAAQRRKTHQLALARAEQYLGNEQNGQTNKAADCLTEAEELKLVQKYCDVILTTGKHLTWPANIYTTAIQYLKRFYLSNSCMTYPPREIYKTILFLASKTEAYHLTLSQFSRLISADPDVVLAPEYKVMQALRFTLDVRQPFRGLKGALMELLNMAEGLVATAGSQGKSGVEVQKGLYALDAPAGSNRTQWNASSTNDQKKKLVERIQLAYAAGKEVLETAASLTDAYFLYTPSQILLAALRVADTPLLQYYLENKLPVELPTRAKILATVGACASMLAAHDPKNSITKDERAALEKKLDGCRDPATKDLVKAHAEMKRNGAGNGDTDEEKAKRKRLEREKNSKEMDDLFGPSLAVPKAAG
jgi:cyclin H